MDALHPYARLLGLRVERVDGAKRFVMPWGNDVLGRPGFLHGGAIAGLCEIAALAALDEALKPKRARTPLGMSIDFLRGGTDRDTFAAGVVRRMGRRIAHVEAAAWQEDEARPIATARMNVLLG